MNLHMQMLDVAPVGAGIAERVRTRLAPELGIPRGVYTSTLAVNSDTHGQILDESYRYTGPHLSEYDLTSTALDGSIHLAWVTNSFAASPSIMYARRAGSSCSRSRPSSGPPSTGTPS